MWNPYHQQIMMARMMMAARGVPQGAASGAMAGFPSMRRNPAYRQAQFQAPQQGGPAAGVGIAGGALSQAEIQHAHDLACRVGSYLGSHLSNVGVGHISAVVAMCFPDSKNSQVKQLVAAHYFDWCIAPPHGQPLG